MNLAGDILDKYTREQVTAYLDKLITGVLQNYKTSLEKGDSNILWSNLGDLTQIRSILHEMKKRDAEREALKNK